MVRRVNRGGGGNKLYHQRREAAYDRCGGCRSSEMSRLTALRRLVLLSWYTG